MNELKGTLHKWNDSLKPHCKRYICTSSFHSIYIIKVKASNNTTLEVVKGRDFISPRYYSCGYAHNAKWESNC